MNNKSLLTIITAILLCCVSQYLYCNLQVNEGEPLTTVMDIKTAIETAFEISDTIIVTGYISDVAETLAFNIPENKKAIWQAAYSSQAYVTAIEIRGDGTL
jgi:hypothetical protein